MGDPACWLDRICPACAAFLDGGDLGRCPRCGRDLSAVEQGDGDLDDA